MPNGEYEIKASTPEPVVAEEPESLDRPAGILFLPE